MKLSPLKLALCLLLSGVLSLSAQSPGAATAFNAAGDIYSSGDFQGAADAYEKLIQSYPTDAVIPTAQVQLGFSYYFLGEYDKALATLDKATAIPVLPPDVRQIVEGLRPQILTAKASNMKETDSQRNPTFEKAIQGFTDFIKKYPKADDMENVLFSRAVAYYQIKKYEDAIKDLEQNIQRFPKSSTIASSKNLLAGILALLAGEELSKGDTADKAKAFALYDRAEGLLREIINEKADVAIINEANFQLGQILTIRANFSADDKKAAIYAEALAAFRAVAPKERIIKWQQQKLDAFPGRRRQALAANNPALIKSLAADNERELKKMAELQGKPDQTSSALMKMAEIYFQQQQLNETRVLLNHSASMLTEDIDKKNRLYLLTMTYALQNAADRAVTPYQEFQSKHKGDPIADNLPVTMGVMYLALGDPTQAITFFDESLAAYPNGRLTGLTIVQKAKAQTMLKNYPEAEKTFKDYLAKNPPADIGVIAQKGLSDIYKDTQKWDDAIASYKVVVDKYPDTAEAIESQYWIAIATQQKGDNAEAIPLLETFVENHSDSPMAPLALYTKATAQIATGKKEDGIASLAEVAEKYPKSQPAPFTYFMISQMRGQEGKTDESIALMKAFIEKYPQDDKVYPAYDFIAQTYVNSAKAADAVTTYREFVSKYPESPQAGEAMNKSAELQRGLAAGLGRYGALNEEERSQWNTYLKGSIDTIEEMIKKYPDSPALALAVQNLLQSQQMLLAAELKKAPEVEAYFQELASSAPSPRSKSKILFSLAAYVGATDEERAFGIMNEAYNPEIVYSPKDLDSYALALVNRAKLNEAAEVFEKLAADYPVPAGVAPTAAPLMVQEAQAAALFGQARIAQENAETAEAGELFAQLKSLYPWSPKVLEADYGIAQSLKADGKYDETLTLLSTIIRATNATAELRANGMLLGGETMVDKMNASSDPETKNDARNAAIDYYIKIAQFYGGVPTVAAEGLWRGAQLLEAQANEATDEKFKTNQLKKAQSAYETLVKDYPSSEHASKAEERAKALGGK